MAAYEYLALDATGKEKKGIVEADSEKQVRQQLRAEGLIPTQVKTVRPKSNHKATQRSKGTIAHHEMVLLTRQLATLIDSGLPVEEALAGVVEQSGNNRVKSLVMSIRSRVLEGHALAVGFGDFPNVFPQMYRASVAAGEESGYLGKVLEQLADYCEEQQELRQKITSAAIYPLMMILVSLGIVVFLLTYVVPQLVSLFEDSGQTLPTLTLFMIAVSDYAKNDGLYLLVVIIGCGFLWRQLLKQANIKKRWHIFLLKLPFIGGSIRTIETARFARTFGILSNSGVPVLDAMRSSAAVVQSIPIQESMLVATDKVREGTPIHTALRETKYFPAMSIHLIATGETSGRLEAMLAKAAATQERDVQALIGRTVTLFEPLMTLVMGGVILLIVLSVLLPIFSLSQNVG